jgi:hypothetical protein
MELTTAEANTIKAILTQIEQKARKPKLPANTIENYCRRIRAILNRGHRRNKVAVLTFRPEDIEL